MHAELEDDLRQIAAVKAEAQRLLAGRSDAEFNRRPAPGRWSAAECLDHLNAIRKVLPAIDRTIAGARARGLRSDGPFRYGWVTRWMIRAFEPPPRRRFKNPKLLEPAPEPLPTSAGLRECLSLRDELARRGPAADGLALKRATAVSPLRRVVRVPP